MASPYDLRALPDEQLLADTRRLVRRDRKLTAEIVAHIAEIDRRQLYLEKACSSLFVYCTDILEMSRNQTFKRTQTARAARRYPAIFGMLALGELHLGGVTLLAPHLTAENHDELLSAATHKPKRDIEKLVAARFPKPDVPAVIRKLPAAKPAEPCPVPPTRELPLPAAPTAEALDGVVDQISYPPHPESPAQSPRPPAAKPAVVAPLSASRFKIQFTADQEFHDKLREAQALLRHQIPTGDIASVMDRALTLLVADANEKKFAKRKHPERSDTADAKSRGLEKPPQPKPKTKPRQRSRHIPAEVKRQVVARDGMRCAFVDTSGRRCKETGFLEFHHKKAHGKGGVSTVANISLYCRAHNAHAASCDYGATVMDERKRAARRRRGSASHEPGGSEEASPGKPDGA